MRGEIIHQIYIADGFDDDCEALIHRCVRAEKLNYKTFCEIWKDMKFDSLYIGRTSMVEIAELSEELIHTAKHYMMAKSSNFEESVAGLFLVYGLINLQPYPGFATLRLVPDDVPAIKKIETIARREKRLDVLYVLGAVLVKHSHYHAEQRERGMEQAFRKYLDGFVGVARAGYRPQGVFYRQTEELDLIKELAAVTDRYETAKKAVTGGKSDASLSFINKNLPSELDSALKKIISGVPGLDDDDEIDAADVHYSNVQAIKEKAMRKAVGSIRHLSSAAERSPEKTVKPRVSDLKSKPGKVKTSSPTKTFMSPKKGAKANSKSNTPTLTSPRRNTANIMSPKLYRNPRNANKNKTSSNIPEVGTSPRNLVAKASTSKPPMRTPVKRKMGTPKRKSKKAKISSESSSDSDVSLSDLDDDDGYDDLDLNAFNKSKDLANAQMVEIEIDKLPTHITTENDGLVCEIEIIDKLDKANDWAKGKSNSNKSRLRTKKHSSLNRLGVLPVKNFQDKIKNNKDKEV